MKRYLAYIVLGYILCHVSATPAAEIKVIVINKSLQDVRLVRYAENKQRTYSRASPEPQTIISSEDGDSFSMTSEVSADMAHVALNYEGWSSCEFWAGFSDVDPKLAQSPYGKPQIPTWNVRASGDDVCKSRTTGFDSVNRILHVEFTIERGRRENPPVGSRL